MADYWSGKDSRIAFMQDNEQVPLDVMSWNVKPNVVKAADGICGENRDRLQTITNFFEGSLTCKQEAAAALRAFLDAQENLDVGATDFQRGVYFLIAALDATSWAFQATGVTLDDWDFRADGRTERNAITVPFRSQYFSALPSL